MRACQVSTIPILLKAETHVALYTPSASLVADRDRIVSFQGAVAPNSTKRGLA